METPKKESKLPTIRTAEKKSKWDHNPIKKDFSTPSRPKFKVSLQGSDDIRKIIVAVRVRPLNCKQLAFDDHCPFLIKDKEIIVKNGYSSDVASNLATTFTYEHVFCSWGERIYNKPDQKFVFEEIALPLLDAALEGYNACLFAYGQTGSGKTYSMMGRDNILNGEDAGIIPRFCEELLNRNFNTDSMFQFSLSYYEIYNEKIHDLLSSSCDNKISLKVREHPVGGPYVENLTKHEINSLEDLRALLMLGNGRRASSATVYNSHSSRSHAIFEICVSRNYKEKAVISKVSLVDLAGSERVSQVNITEERFKEGLSINKSLLTLGKVITSLSDQKKGTFVPYRDSVLTWLLKESLGGNSRTVMLATVSPNILALEETLSTLRYACQARHILNRVTINEDPQLKLIRELREEVERLKSLRDYKKHEQMKREHLNEKTRSAVKSEYIKYENELLNIEMAQKKVEEQLQAELSRLGMHLEAAEKRRDELESQKSAFFDKIKRNKISHYQSDFFENLQDILNSSTSSASQSCINKETSEISTNLMKLNKYLQNIKVLCSSNKENDTNINRIQPLVEYMDKCYQDICEIMSPSS